MIGSRSNNESRPLHVTWVGSSGRAVAEFLHVLRPETCITDMAPDSPSAADDRTTSSAEVLAAWRPVPALAAAIAASCRMRQTPFIPLIFDCGVIRLGPIIVPSGPCWSCWLQRSQQHCSSPTQRAALERFYDANPQAGPQGFLHPLAMLAASQISRTLCLLKEHPDQMGGYIWESHISTRRVDTGYLLGVDGCSTCGLKRPVETRTYADVRHALEILWRGAERVS